MYPIESMVVNFKTEVEQKSRLTSLFLFFTLHFAKFLKLVVPPQTVRNFKRYIPFKNYEKYLVCRSPYTHRQEQSWSCDFEGLSHRALRGFSRSRGVRLSNPTTVLSTSVHRQVVRLNRVLLLCYPVTFKKPQRGDSIVIKECAPPHKAS